MGQRLIDANAFDLKLFNDGFFGGLACIAGNAPRKRKFTIGEFRGMLAKAPTVDAVPVVHGRWVQGYEIEEGFFEENMEIPYVECSCCGFVGWHLDIEDIGTVDFKLNYCPHCGAKMNKEANHEPI